MHSKRLPSDTFAEDQHVESDGEFELFPNRGMNLYDTAKDFSFRYNVRVMLNSRNGCVKLHGRYAQVADLIAEEFSSNEKPGVETTTYIDAMLGDKVALHRWNTGCRVDQSPAGKFAWDAHFDAAGYRSVWESGEELPVVAEANEQSIALLAEAGYEPDMTGNDPSGFAQTYLTLAVLHCPELDPVFQRAFPANQPKPSIPGVWMDAFNLFVGAAFQFEPHEDQSVWVVMDFQDGGEGATSIMEEKIKVRLRDATDAEGDVRVRDWVFDYDQQVWLVGNVRNANDLDDNNWGNR